MTSPRVLVAGVGNIFFGDDAFGVEVVKLLASRNLPESVSIREFGIRGLDLSYELLKPYDLILLVDVARRGEPPGTVVALKPTFSEMPQEGSPAMHGMIPTKAFEFAMFSGASLQNVQLIVCEPGSLEPTGEISDLTPDVTRAVKTAAALIEELIREFFCERVAYA